ncbi:MAG: excinuclease ABC subunit C [Deltaproteobacteria bacterium RIFCSPLOWO2_02_FULL_46_8]|nr:MAG: excinuclease ABC subunit C [Deltaproteobacteria bacterium RIFCSPLOWO2_02_FULL_46_8]
MLQEKIKNFPKSCGVYWMKDAAGHVLYVGKAKNLRSRVKSYFKKESKSRFQIDFLMRRTADIEFLVTDNEKEALLLENTLIKKHNPRYNFLLKDDKSYASLKLTHHAFPALFITRDVVKDGSLYFGPYSSAGALRQTVDWLTKHFQLRTCSDHEFANRSRPCLEFHIGRCTAPCVGKVSAEKYASQVDEVKLFLSGQKKELIQKLKNRMTHASEGLRYEEAAHIRDLIAYAKETLEKQKVMHHGGKNYDCLGFAATKKESILCILVVRGGTLIDRLRFDFPLTPTLSPILSQFILQYYGALMDLPSQILLPCKLEDLASLEEILEEKSGHAVSLSVPRRGEAAKMTAMAIQNAKHWAESKIKTEETVIERLQAKLSLQQAPHIIECVDISNLQGEHAVGSLVCFADGKPFKNRYRKFKIQMTKGPNDYAMMYEVLLRRFRRALEWPAPDLLLVDGGKGQLQIALKALADLGLHQQAVIAIAKAKGEEKSDKIFIPGQKNPVSFRSNSPELLYLMRIRDEAHRFGITYHRSLRSKALFASPKNPKI